MAILTKIGYGQVEPNHLSAQGTGQIYAQTPAHSDITALENGSFLKMNSTTGKVGITGNGEWMLVLNEVKLYENHKQGYKDFAILSEESVGGVIVPRLFKTNIGDRFTTNLVFPLVKDTLALGQVYEIAVGAAAPYDTVGVLTEVDATDNGYVATAPRFEVIKVYTMPDGQAAVKLVQVA